MLQAERSFYQISGQMVSPGYVYDYVTTQIGWMVYYSSSYKITRRDKNNVIANDDSFYIKRTAYCLTTSCRFYT